MRQTRFRCALLLNDSPRLRVRSSPVQQCSKAAKQRQSRLTFVAICDCCEPTSPPSATLLSSHEFNGVQLKLAPNTFKCIIFVQHLLNELSTFFVDFSHCSQRKALSRTPHLKVCPYASPIWPMRTASNRKATICPLHHQFHQPYKRRSPTWPPHHHRRIRATHLRAIEGVRAREAKKN